MAMKKVKLGLFFLGKNKADNLLEAEQTGEEDSAAINDEGDAEADNPVDVQLFDEEGNYGNRGQEQDDMQPIPTTQVELEDALGEEVLQEGGDGLYAEAGAGGTNGLETRDDDEVEQDVNDHARCCDEVELLEAAVGGEQSAEDVCC